MRIGGSLGLQKSTNGLWWRIGRSYNGKILFFVERMINKKSLLCFRTSDFQFLLDVVYLNIIQLQLRYQRLLYPKLGLPRLRLLQQQRWSQRYG